MKRGSLLSLVVVGVLALGACQQRAYRMVSYQPIDRSHYYDQQCDYADDRYVRREARRRARAERRAVLGGVLRFGL